MKKTKARKMTMEMAMNNPRYRGYHVIVVAGKVFKARTGEGAAKILDEARQKYPKAIPEITYIPDADTRVFNTYGVGGSERVYFLPKIKVKLGKWGRIIPVGFLERNEIPPLMGRHLFLETFETLFSTNHVLSFSTP